MNPQENPIVTSPGSSQSMRVTLGPTPERDEHAPESVTTISAFEAVSHLLSEKPLRRPNRTKPVGAD